MDYTQWAVALGDAFSQVTQRVGAQLPKVLSAGALLLIGWGLARLLRASTARGLARLGRFVNSQPIQSALRRVGVEQPASEVVSAIVFWVVLILFVTAATETLGLPLLATWFSGLSQYLPRVLLAILILFAGLLLSAFARDAIGAAAAAAGITYDTTVGRLAQTVILMIAVVTAVDQTGLDSRFLTTTITITVAAVLGAGALAFALGARTAVSNIIAAHYLRQTYQVGHTVRVGAVQGRIIGMTSSGVLLESADGRVLVPAKEFSETISVLVTTVH